MAQSVAFTQMQLQRTAQFQDLLPFCGGAPANSDILVVAMFLLLTIHLQSRTSKQTYQISSPLAPLKISAQLPAMRRISS